MVIDGSVTQKDIEIQKLIKDQGLELFFEISSDEENFEKKLSEIVIGPTVSYLLIVKNYAGPEDDIIYQVYLKK